MYRIVVPVDDTVKRAAEQARFISELPVDTSDFQVTVAHAYQDDTHRTSGETIPDEESPAVIEAVQRLEQAGIEVNSRELYLPVAKGIIDLATELEADSIVIGGRKRSPAGKALFGSVTQSVILESTIPVTIVGGE